MFQYIVNVRYIFNDFLLVGIHDNFSRIDTLLGFLGSYLFDNYDNTDFLPFLPCLLCYVQNIQVQDAILPVAGRYGKCLEYSIFCMLGKENLKRTKAEVAVVFVAIDTLFIINYEEKGRISMAECDTIRNPLFPDAPYVIT
jgi:hypothetical protein